MNPLRAVLVVEAALAELEEAEREQPLLDGAVDYLDQEQLGLSALGLVEVP